MTLTMSELEALLNAAAERAAGRVLARLAPQSDLISQNEAWRTYGRGVVERLVESGSVSPRRVGPHDNSKKMYSRTELETATGRLDISSVLK